MNKEETKMMKDAINAAILQKTKEEILSELAYTVKMVDSKTNKEASEKLKGRIAQIVEQVEWLFDDIEINIAMED